MEAVRVLVGLKSLAGKHKVESLERACQTALTYNAKDSVLNPEFFAAADGSSLSGTVTNSGVVYLNFSSRRRSSSLSRVRT